jgi:hypothetical protein
MATTVANTNLIPAGAFNLTAFNAETPLPESWDAAVGFLKENGVAIEHAAAVLVDEFPEVDKKDLVNVEFVLFNWTISEDGGDYGSQFVTCRGITRTGNRFRFSDGSTGVYRQLVKLTSDRLKDGSATPNGGLMCGKGLTKSEYTYTDEKGKKTPAVTYYISAE